MSQPITVVISDEVMGALQRQASQQHRTPEELGADVLEATIHPDSADPVLRLLGSVECDEVGFADRHDEYIGEALMAELRDRKDG